jgi:hypothetical protein
MAQVTIQGRELNVRLTSWERLSIWRSEVRIPLTAIRHVELLGRPLWAVNGTRRGVEVTGVLKVGVWSGGRLVSVQQGLPALRVVFEGDTRIRELILSTPDAAELAQLLGAEVKA